jgi:hypothetical protein
LFLACLGLALVLTGCGGGAGESYWTRDQFDSGTGAVTITGIPGGYHSKYAMIYVTNNSTKDLIGGAYPPGECAKITGATTTFPIRDISHLGMPPDDEAFFGTLPPAYTGSDSGLYIIIGFTNDKRGSSEYQTWATLSPVTFSSGNVTVAWVSLSQMP